MRKRSFEPEKTNGQHIWKIEQPAHAVANGFFIGCINRVGVEKPWNLWKFYGHSYFVNPRGEIIAEGSEDNDEIVIADIDLNKNDEVRTAWQFTIADRKPTKTW